MKTAYRLSILAAAMASMGAGFLATSTAQTPDDRMVRPPEATIYRDAGYRGPAVFIGEAKPNLGLAWPVNSIRVPNGRWELCERTRYRGTCRTVDRDTPMLNNNPARHHRPVDPSGRLGRRGRLAAARQ